MTNQEWREREIYYEQKVKRIVIPSEVDTQTVKRLVSEIDSLLTEAVFDYARAKNSMEEQVRFSKAYQKQHFLFYKQNENMSDKTAEAASVTSAEKAKVLERETIAIQRFNYMNMVIEILRDKREMLITDSGILKLEANM